MIRERTTTSAATATFSPTTRSTRGFRRWSSCRTGCPQETRGGGSPEPPRRTTTQATLASARSRSELVERALDALADCLEHLKAREFLVVRLHERPGCAPGRRALNHVGGGRLVEVARSEEHTSELQSLRHLVCRLL